MSRVRKYIDPDIKILQAFAGSWTDPLKGKELTLAQYEQGADIVMNVASVPVLVFWKVQKKLTNTQSALT